MDLQSLSLAQSAIQKFQDKLYTFKERAMVDHYSRSELGHDYARAVTTLNIELKDSSSTDADYDLEEKMLNINKLSDLICKVSGKTTYELIKYKGRLREFVQPKQVHIAMLNKVFGLSLKAAGGLYSRDHATTLHSCKTVRNLYQTDKDYRDKYKSIFDHCSNYDKVKTENFLNDRS